MDGEVIVKGELHSSSADLAQEKSLVRQGIDALVLEGRAEQSPAKLGSEWFVLSIILLTWILDASYNSKDVLIELTKEQGGDVYFTRTSDLEMIEGVPVSVKALSAAGFYLLLPGSVWIGFFTGDQIVGSIMLVWGITLPIVFIRVYNMMRPDPGHNRDQLIADRIKGATESGRTVLAVIGAGHLPGVTRRLQADYNLDIHRPRYPPWAIQHLQEVFLPACKAGLIVFSLYLLIVWLSIQTVNILSFALMGILSLI